MTFEVGRICIKTAGRDAGSIAVIVEVLDKRNVLIDGQVRRRKCNILHLEPTSKEVKLSKGAGHDSVVKELKALGIEVAETKPKRAVPRPKKIRKGKKAKIPKKTAEKKPSAKKMEGQKAEEKTISAPEKKE